MRLREVVVRKPSIEGDRADFEKQVKDRELTFTDWSVFDNRFGKGLVLQFFDGGKPYVYITHSKCLEEDVLEWEKLKGKEPFTATVSARQTRGGREALVFI